MDETFEAVQMLIDQGKVRYAGVSNYSGGQMAEAEKHIHIVSNQIPYSMINRGVEKETVRYCLDHKKAVLAYRPLESGLLTGTINPELSSRKVTSGATVPASPMKTSGASITSSCN